MSKPKSYYRELEREKRNKKINSTLTGAIIALVVVAFIASAVFLISLSKDNEESTEEEKTEFTLEDIKSHNNKDDCWMAIEDKVYNVSEFTVQHPGGDAILDGCGTDATELFETRPMGSGTEHSSSAHALLGDYYIGALITE